jgi:hypothetical protein
MARRFLWIVPVLAVFAACGGGAESGGAKAPREVQDQDQDKEPASVEEARAQLDRARAQLETQPAAPMHVEAGQPTTSGGGGGATQPQTNPQTQPPPQVESDCARMCRAFASMQRAQAALCRMAGEDDPQCVDAKKVVADSAQRVARCACPR